MMSEFVSTPNISMDLTFNGVQDSMNDFILRLISSKMINNSKLITPDVSVHYVSRIQPKYYFKLQKSLEHNKHGILSAIIVYKLLLYFLESDFSINEDYLFGAEDCRQFYIRREILRAIASHTCEDIYQMNDDNFSFLLILCDEAQEWGRKSISELYNSKSMEYSFQEIKQNEHKWEIIEQYY